MIFLSVEEVIKIHDDLVSEFGGLQGIRDMGLLISAIEMPKSTMFGEDLHKSVFDKAAAYLYHIVCNHAFLDGNKRTGSACALIFLTENGYQFKYDMMDFEKMVCKVASGFLKKEEISQFFQNPIMIKEK